MVSKKLGSTQLIQMCLDKLPKQNTKLDGYKAIQAAIFQHTGHCFSITQLRAMDYQSRSLRKKTAQAFSQFLAISINRIRIYNLQAARKGRKQKEALPAVDLYAKNKKTDFYLMQQFIRQKPARS